MHIERPYSGRHVHSELATADRNHNLPGHNESDFISGPWCHGGFWKRNNFVRHGGISALRRDIGTYSIVSMEPALCRWLFGSHQKAMFSDDP